MEEVFNLIVISGLLFFIFLATFLFGILKRRGGFILQSVMIFALMVGVGCWTGYRVANKSYTKITGMVAPRTGEAIYAALFGAPREDCVKVVHYQDQVIPKIDYAIWLYVDTCPDELKRVLSRHAFSVERLSTKSWKNPIPYGESIDWFNPAAMADTIVVYEYSSDDSQNIQTLYASLDSTKMFCRDIAD